MSIEAQSIEPVAPRWHALGAIERRVLGVLIEKAKTTPENYPLSLNSLRAGCNQKSNRAPLMQLEEEQIEDALETLRESGVVLQIQGGGRVDKYRHLAYEWLGVEKVELAVMAELLLRGPQTVGELRGRSSRMEPIKDIAELQPTLDSLHAKGLLVYLSPPGRGSLVTHALYSERELEKARQEGGAGQFSGQPAARHAVPGAMPPSAAPRAETRSSSDDGGTRSRNACSPQAEGVLQELQQLREELASVKRELAAARGEFEGALGAVRRELDQLNRQLGN
jgi:hypothetical protein